MTSPAPISGCTAWAGPDDIPSGPADLHSPTQWCAYLAMATDILWASTGRRWRGDTRSEDVVLRGAPPRAGEGSWPYQSSWGHCPCFAGVTAAGLPRWADGTYDHRAPVAVRLPRRDVVAVTEVTIGGEAFEAWRLDGVWLARTDGRGWSVCRDLTEVTYDFGRPPPDAARAAVVELAVEIGRGASEDPDQACALPKRVQSVTRQGITFAALDNFELIDKGWTGLANVDLWIKSVNPRGRAQEARVWSPDLPVARRNGGT